MGVAPSAMADDLRHLQRRYALASAINAAIVHSAHEQQLYEEACRLAVEPGGCRLAWIGLSDHDAGAPRVVAQAGDDAGYLARVLARGRAGGVQGLGPGGRALRTGSADICNDIADDGDDLVLHDEALARGFRSCAGFPLAIQGSTVGVLLVYSEHPRHFDPDECKLFAALAEGISFAVSARRSQALHRRIEQSLTVSESRLQAMYDHAPECVKTLSLDGLVIDINPVGLRLLEASSRLAVVGKPYADFVHPRDRENFLHLLGSVAAGKTARLEYRAVGLRGNVLWMATNAVPLPGEHGAVSSVFSLSRDVTAERAAADALLRSAALLRIASRLGCIGAWEMEVPAGVVTWSEELCTRHEVEKGFQPTFEQMIAFYAPEHRQVIESLLAACIRDGMPFDQDLDIITATRRRVHGRTYGEALRDSQGAIYRVQGAFQDITARRHAEDATQALADRLATTLGSITDAFFTLDRDWRLTYLNAEAQRILENVRGDVLGRPIWGQLPASLGAALQPRLEHAMAHNEVVKFDEVHPPLNACFEVQAYPSPVGLAVHFRDVTERNEARDEILSLNARLENRVRERTAQLESANRELSAFSYSVAHDLRAPLSAVTAFNQALTHQLKDVSNDKARHYLQRMHAGLRQTQDMIDALLSLSKLARAQLRWEPVDLAPMARSAFENARHKDPARDAVLHVPQALGAQGDPRLLQLVLDNLVGNAWKFTGRRVRAEITVDTEPGPDGKPIYFVRDNGAGFDMDYADKLFGAFQRMHAEADFPGTGIGLANVARIVSRHGGRVWARSAPEQGATFYFTLAREAPEDAAEDTPPQTAHAAPGYNAGGGI